MTAIQPPSVLLMGMPGTGKSYSLSTLLKAGLHVAILGTEAGFIDTVLDACATRKIPLDNLHWHALQNAAPSWDALEQVGKTTAAMSYESLASLKDGIAKREMKGWMALLHACRDFPDDKTGTKLGDVTEWGPDWCFVIDSLSGVNDLAREHVTGYKPNLHPGEWATAQELERNLIRKLVVDRKCFFVLITHLDRTVDEVTQTPLITVAALGSKLGPKIPKDFSEVVQTKRPGKAGDPFTWSTLEANADVKNRALPIQAGLPADFTPIVDAYRRRIAATTPVGGAA